MQPTLRGRSASIPQQVYRLSESKDSLSELYNLLGDLQWITGNVQAAIACQQKAILLSTQELDQQLDQQLTTDKHRLYYLKMIEVDSLLSMGIYNIDLWELETAKHQFEHVIAIAQNTDHHRWAEKASVCLALVTASLGEQDTARTLADQIYAAIAADQFLQQAGRFAYFMQRLGQTYLNLGEGDRANEIFTAVLTFAEEGHYTQTKAKTLTGLAELHRQQADFELAIANHQQAIHLLDCIGARCDLAEAYYQLSLTYRAMEQAGERDYYLQQAIDLFKAMDAPRQIERILGSNGTDVMFRSAP
jgi:tetratricopeptide (TPR) repeat protein